ncbi:putative baseplate assembly protein [Ideonella azotifigens]|uniref:Baseplate assembly protein n=1 Tax=Ideonella azotifigens TaxID=513160 RepID=A0ABN1KEM6_9BURK|nr:putative baseplate assembly protein [Ideonella azotifigens]MCD2340788.1 putative baseplate assembly protein [Ideonella azotifigens]
MKSCSTCGAFSLPCGCCEGTTVLTPAVIHNRPGLPELAYRVGTHATFFESMMARLATTEVDGVTGDGQTPQTFRPLQALTTRDRGDFGVALLDGWATVADLLAFYQERIANEGYLRTATERRSVLELARLVGYTLRPGVAASVYLAYALDDNQIEATVIATGARAQSLPGPGETPQSFETSEDLDARREWNNLQVRMTRPQNITLDTALLIDRVVVSDSVNGLRAGDPLMLLFADDGSLAAMRSIRSTEGPTADGKSTIRLDPVPDDVALTIGLLTTLVTSMQPFRPAANDPTAEVIDKAGEVLRKALLDPITDPRNWPEEIQNYYSDDNIDEDVQALINTFRSDIADLLEVPPPSPPPSPPPPPSTNPDLFVNGLLKPRVLQARNSLQLRRDLGHAFARGADTAPQMLLSFAPPLRDTYYRAWVGANENIASAVLVGVFVLRSNASLFGASVQKLVTVTNGTVPPQDQWREWTLDGETKDGLYLDQLHTEITAPSYVLVRRMENSTPLSRIYTVKQAITTPRTAYGISGKSTHLQLDREWWAASVPNVDGSGANDMPVLRATQVWAQSVPLTLVEEPITTEVGSQPDDPDNLSLELASLHKELASGRWVILQGERSDIEGVQGVKAAELMMVASLVHGYDPNLAGDKIHTTLKLATRSAFRYKRESVVVYGNVVRATHGETRNEMLGNGDATQALQSFTLKQPPLTFVSVPTASGAESTLAVYVDDVRWHETTSLAWLGTKDRGFVTRTDDAGLTQVVFGDGEHGTRLPTGVQNVRAVYRSGIGAPGNVKAEQISLLATRPLGVKAVINPLRSSGGTDREDRDLARSNAPLAVMSLDRLVSVSDYADFTRTFAGIAKAVATRASDGQREIVLLTIAGVDDAPIDKTSDLYRNLLAALRALGDPDLPLRVEPRELLALVLSAGVALLPDYSWEPVADAVRNTLLQRFGFGQRGLGQSVRLAEVISAIQGVRGVAYVDVDTFGSVPEKVAGSDGTRRLVTQSEVTSAVARALHPDQSNTQRLAGLAGHLPPDVIAFPGGNDRGVLRPAELAIFTPAVADTLILNQLLS